MCLDIWRAATWPGTKWAPPGGLWGRGSRTCQSSTCRWGTCNTCTPVTCTYNKCQLDSLPVATRPNPARVVCAATNATIRAARAAARFNLPRALIFVPFTLFSRGICYCSLPSIKSWTLNHFFLLSAYLHEKIYNQPSWSPEGSICTVILLKMKLIKNFAGGSRLIMPLSTLQKFDYSNFGWQKYLTGFTASSKCTYCISS